MAIRAYAIATALALSACAAPTPYKLESTGNPSAGGYNEQQVESDRWKVAFSGNSLTPRDTVERYLLFRAALLTELQPYDWFESADRNVRSNSRYYSDGDPFFGGWPGSYWNMYRGRRHWGGGYWGSPALASVDVERFTNYDATAEIIMGRGAQPADSDSYNAKDVISHLQGSIQYPSAST